MAASICFGWGVVLAATLYVLDHLFFALAFALKTYFQKIADPADIAPTAAVAFTINHIAAVFLPASLGYLWLISPALVFELAAGMAAVSFLLTLLIPRHPEPGHETVFGRRPAQATRVAPGPAPPYMLRQISPEETPCFPHSHRERPRWFPQMPPCRAAPRRSRPRRSISSSAAR